VFHERDRALFILHYRTVKPPGNVSLRSDACCASVPPSRDDTACSYSALIGVAAATDVGGIYSDDCYRLFCVTDPLPSVSAVSCIPDARTLPKTLGRVIRRVLSPPLEVTDDLGVSLAALYRWIPDAASIRR